MRGAVVHGLAYGMVWWDWALVMGLVLLGLIVVLGYVGDVSLRYRLIVFG